MNFSPDGMLHLLQVTPSVFDLSKIKFDGDFALCIPNKIKQECLCWERSKKNNKQFNFRTDSIGKEN